MPSNLRLGALLVCGAVLAAVPGALPAEAQDTPAARCSVAVNAQDLDGVIESCPAALEELPTDHPFYEHFRQTLDYALGQKCQPAAQAQDWDAVINYCVPAAAGNYRVNFLIGLAYQAKQDWANAGPYFEMFVSAAEGDAAGRAQQADQIAAAQRSGGIAMANAGAPDRAIPLLRGAAAANASDIEVQYRLGVALAQTGDTAGAERALSVVIAEGPDSGARTNALLMAGQLNAQAGDCAKASERLTEYIGKGDGSRDADLHVLVAQTCQQSDTEKATTHYRGFLESSGAAQHQAYADALFALGTIYYNADDCANAEQYYQTLMEAAPGHANAAQVTDILASIAEGACGGGDC